MFKKRSYIEELEWYFDKANHTTIDKIEIFIRYLLLSPKNLKYFIRSRFKHYLAKLIIPFCKTGYTVTIWDNFTQHNIIPFTNISVKTHEYTAFYDTIKSPIYFDFDEAYEQLTKLNKAFTTVNDKYNIVK